MKKYLLIMQQSPYKNSLALEALELALALCSLNQQVSLLLKGEAIRQLLVKQDPTQIICKDFTNIYTGLNLFGIENIYIEQSSANEYSKSELLMQPKLVNVEQMVHLIKDHDIVFNI